MTVHWFDLLQTVVIVGGLLFTAYATLRDERAHKVGNLIAVTGQHREIWSVLYEDPRLSRVLKKDVDLEKEAITEQEALFVKLLILHLGTVYRAMKERMFVQLEGLQNDIREFFSLPIPKEIWRRYQQFQDKDFAEFVSNCQRVSEKTVRP